MNDLRDYYLQHMGIGEVWKVRDAVDTNSAVAVDLPMTISSAKDILVDSQESDQKRTDHPHNLNQSDESVLGSAPRTNLRELDVAISNCVQCDLCQRFGRHQISSRPKSTDILLISEFAAPLEVDLAEKLLQNLALALSNSWQSRQPSQQQTFNVWRSSVLRASAPMSYDKDEVAQKADICLSWLAQEIDLLRPRAIVVLGEAIANTLLETEVRSHSHEQYSGASFYREIPLFVTYSIAELLASPILKAQVWTTMCQLKGVLSTKNE